MYTIYLEKVIFKSELRGPIYTVIKSLEIELRALVKEHLFIAAVNERSYVTKYEFIIRF